LYCNTSPLVGALFILHAYILAFSCLPFSRSHHSFEPAFCIELSNSNHFYKSFFGLEYMTPPRAVGST
jgi:hypothetical protein